MVDDIFQCKNTNLIVYILVALFGIGSWIDINGLWVELPVIVPHLPEGWKLPSYLSVIIQVANIGPLLVTLMYIFCKQRMNERVVVYLVLGIGAVACLLLSFFWKETVFFAGEMRSMALLVLQFFLALTDCTTSVLFLPFMSSFKSEYITAYYIGEGLSGLIPSVVALGQGVGQLSCVNVSQTNLTTNETSYSIQPTYHSTRFSVEEFFYFLFGMLIVSILSFTILNYVPYCKKEKVKHQDDYEEVSDSSTGNKSNVASSYELYNGETTESSSTFSNPSSLNSRSNLTKKKSKDLEINSHTFEVSTIYFREIMSSKQFVLLLIIIGWVNSLTNGVLPSLQTYSTLPYGNDAYHLAATLSNIANPLACFVAFFVTAKSSTMIAALTVVGSGLSGYIILTAVGSPTPVLHHSMAGSVIVVAVWVLNSFLMSYVKVSIAGIFRQEGKKALLWVGGLSQVGSAIGALITFVLVNVYNVFVSAPVC